MPSTVAFVPSSTPGETGTARPTMPFPANIRSTRSGQGKQQQSFDSSNWFSVLMAYPKGANTLVPSDSQFIVPTLANVLWASTEPSLIGLPNSAGSDMGWCSFSSEPSASGRGEYMPCSQRQDPPKSESVPQWCQTDIEVGTQSNWTWAAEPSRTMPFSRGLMATRQQQMPVASGQLHQHADIIESFCGSDAVAVRAWPDASQFAARGGAPAQEGHQQMVLQHQQQSSYRQQPSGFYGWEFSGSQRSLDSCLKFRI